ncbi:hypothetical protein TRIUR3_01477 [Triticum urartu]|uniref:Uncharacterized protein n=1 Tax=Triticum urartu TaxID=4572 RepID=M8AAA7_TRIUA|nr:hypothetical protein TRIUR3_01477 [Triticum urartu]
MAAAGGGAGGVAGVAGSPCGACKFLRRRCVAECVFAPYFSSEQGAARFAAIHKVFGASNAAKLLAHLPLADRCEAVVTITYEAQSRLRDPVYGCVAQIFALQQQVAILQAQLMQARAQIAVSHQWPDSSSSSIASLLRQQEVKRGKLVKKLVIWSNKVPPPPPPPPPHRESEPIHLLPFPLQHSAHAPN